MRFNTFESLVMPCCYAEGRGIEVSEEVEEDAKGRRHQRRSWRGRSDDRRDGLQEPYL